MLKTTKCLTATTISTTLTKFKTPRIEFLHVTSEIIYSIPGTVGQVNWTLFAWFHLTYWPIVVWPRTVQKSIKLCKIFTRSPGWISSSTVFAWRFIRNAISVNVCQLRPCKCTRICRFWRLTGLIDYGDPNYWREHCTTDNRYYYNAHHVVRI